MRSYVTTGKSEHSNSSPLQRKSALRIGDSNDAFEQEADKTADAVILGKSSGLGHSLSKINISSTLQRDEPGKPKSEEEKYKEAAKKIGEAFLETGPGKQIKEKAEKLGDAFISTLPGKIITGTAITGAVATLAATHKELPIGIPEIPLDRIKPGLKLKITYEGPVDKPTKVMASFSFPLGAPKTETKPKMSKSEKYRAETARMAKELYDFRESLKTPQQREEEQRMMDAWLMSHLPGPGKLTPLGTGGLPKPLAPYASEFKIPGEQPRTEEPEKKKKEEETTVQRKATSATQESYVHDNVNNVLQSPGKPLDPSTRGFMEARFGYQFDHVRIHSDDRAERSARSMSARAFTVGNNIVFSSGQYSPQTSSGRWLLAHELTHVLQQGAADTRVNDGPNQEHDLQFRSEPTIDVNPNAGDSISRTTGPVLQRGFFEWLDDLFGGTDFSKEELQVYLRALTEKKGPIGGVVADNKARVLVQKWKKDKSAFDLTQEVKVYLIKEMQLGFTGDDDEKAILDLLKDSDAGELLYMFSADKLTAKNLDDDFQGEEKKELHAFFDSRFTGGMAALLKGEVKPMPPKFPAPSHLKSPYTRSQIKEVIEAHIKVLQIRLKLITDPNTIFYENRDMVRRAGEQIAKDLKVMPAADRETAVKDLQNEELSQSQDYRDVKLKIEIEQEALKKAKGDKTKTSTLKAKLEELKEKRNHLGTSVLMMQIALEGSYKDVALTTPRKELLKTTTPLSKEQAHAAREAIKPDVLGVRVEAGKPPPKPPPFVETLPGEAKSYGQKVEERTPDMVKENWEAIAKPRGVKEHADPKKTHDISELQSIANVSKDETDLVFGSYRQKPAFKTDKRTKGGKLISRGNIRDAWAVEQEKGKSKAYRKSSAHFWMFYLLQNDNVITDINFKHHAQPKFNDKEKPQNKEAKFVEKAGNKFLKNPVYVKQLFEIGRGWDAFNVGRTVFVQLFKNPDALEDRKFLWDMFFVLIHEYLHTLASGKYNAYADKLGGEKSPEGNALIEGVDSLLTEIVWSNARPRASLDKVRNAVEPEAVKAKLPFDEKLLPLLPHRRYDTYDRALRLVRVVGIKNLYAAYFRGKIKLIGGK